MIALNKLVALTMKKPNHVYLNIKGWFPTHIVQEVIDYLTEHMEAEVKKE
jgi:hypothetical protein